MSSESNINRFICCDRWYTARQAGEQENLHCIGARWQQQKSVYLFSWLTNDKIQWDLIVYTIFERKLHKLNWKLESRFYQHFWFGFLRAHTAPSNQTNSRVCRRMKTVHFLFSYLVWHDPFPVHCNSSLKHICFIPILIFRHQIDWIFLLFFGASYVVFFSVA